MFTRQTHNSSFIAYAANPSKKPLPVRVAGSDTTARVYADVFINVYVSVKVQQVQESSTGDTVNVRFDPASVVTTSGTPMKYAFGANTKAGSPIHHMAVAAQQTGRPVYVGLETHRRYRSMNGDVIPYTTPIDVLRGCENGPQSRGNSNITRDNCSKVIAAMGWADEPDNTLFSDEAHSNPATWPSVYGNQDGDCPPEGFTAVTLADGSRVGAVVKANTTTSQAENTALREEVNQLKKMISNLQSSGSSTSARPWNERTADGQVNPGSYAVSAARDARYQATTLVAQAGATDVSADTLRQVETSLTRVILWMADRVQSSVTGHVDRSHRSHGEARAWVHHVATFEDHYTASMVGVDDESLAEAKKWACRVVEAASERFIEAVALTEEYLQQTTGVHAPAPAQQQPSAQVTVADSEQALTTWNSLIEKAGLVDNIGDLDPLLTATFGSCKSTAIPADALIQRANEWAADIEGFKNLARQTWKKAHATAA